MAEIKSTLELVMERTSRMVLTEEEKLRTKTKEMEDRIKGILLSLEEGRARPEELPQILARTDDYDPQAMKDSMVTALIAALSLEGDNESFLAGLLALNSRNLSADIEKIRTIQADYQRNREALARTALGEALSSLNNLGISGSAVTPNLELDPGYRRKLAELSSAFEERLDQHRKQMNLSVASHGI